FRSRRRFPAFQIPESYAAVFEQDAGYLLVEECVRTHIEAAKRLGAALRTNEVVQEWRAENGGVMVETDRGRYTAGRLIVSPGAWAVQVLRDLSVGLRVVRKHLHWFANDDARFREDHGCPTFFYEIPQGYFYGFPQIDGRGVKVACHSGGDEVTDPLTVDRTLDPTEAAAVQAFLAAHLPGVSSQPTGHTVCMYTMTPDEHFLVDQHPQWPHVVLTAGLSGHGFKFTSVLGEIMAVMALEGRANQPVE